MTDEEREYIERCGTDLEKRMLLELDAVKTELAHANATVRGMIDDMAAKMVREP